MCLAALSAQGTLLQAALQQLCSRVCLDVYPECAALGLSLQGPPKCSQLPVASAGRQKLGLRGSRVALPGCKHPASRGLCAPGLARLQDCCESAVPWCCHKLTYRCHQAKGLTAGCIFVLGHGCRQELADCLTTLPITLSLVFAPTLCVCVYLPPSHPSLQILITVWCGGLPRTALCLFCCSALLWEEVPQLRPGKRILQCVDLAHPVADALAA